MLWLPATKITDMDHLSARQRSELMSRVRSRDTKPEPTVRSLVHRMGFRFRLHPRDLPGRPDLVFRSQRKVIFVHGCFWHQHSCKRGTQPKANQEFWLIKLKRNRGRDHHVIRQLKTLGWTVLVIWECQVSDQTKLHERLRRFLARPLQSATTARNHRTA